LRVSVLDVGQGDSILITTPDGRRILVDGGASGSAVLNALGAELPPRAGAIDLVVLTHPQEDHVAGLVAVTERYDVRLAVVSGSTSESAAYEAWLAALAAGDVPLDEVVAGETADLGVGVRLEVLAPPPSPLSGTDDDVNNASVVLRLTYGSVSFLLTGDLGEEGEEWLLANHGILQSTVLKVGHHGSDTSSTDAFLGAVKPAVAVISAGQDNPYGHPSPTTLLRLSGVPIFRTDRNGAVRFETDGQRLFVEPERGSYQLVPISAR
jgi:competence protein ComEC